MDVLRLTVRGASDGGWSVQIGTPTMRSVQGQVPARTVAALQAQADRLRAPIVVVRPGLDPWLTHLEEEFGRALGAALLDDPAVGAAWARHAGRAEARNAIRVIMLEGDDDVLALPWELLAESPARAPMEAEGTGCIAILGDGVVQDPPGGPLAVDVLSDDLRDPLVAALAQTGQPAAAAAAEDCRRLIHLVEHGTDQGYGLALGNDAGKGMGTAVHEHQHGLRQAWLVHLAICDAGARPSLAVQRVLDAGAHAVLAPTDRVDTDVVQVVAETLAQAAQTGTLVEAVLAARRAVRMMARPYPDARWFRLRLTVASSESLLPSPSDTPALPPARTPAPPTSLEDVLHVARTDAEASLSGFLGVEHLLLALADIAETSAQLRYAISMADVRTRFSGWRFMTERPCTQTPRLAEILAHCPLDMDIPTFEQRLRTAAEPLMSWLLGMSSLDDSGEGTWATLYTQEDGAPSLAVHSLEVLGGPEDGRRIALTPGMVLGRWAQSPRADVWLYQNTALTDPRLSRTHLRWDGAGVTALAPLARVRKTHQTPLSKGGTCEVYAGDILLCSSVSVLRACGADSAP